MLEHLTFLCFRGHRMPKKKTDLNMSRSAAGRKSLVEAVRAPAYLKFKESAGLIIPLGTTRDGELEVLDFSKDHHMLVAGSVMSGKTEFLNCVISSVALSYLPEEVKLVLIDTTRVEFLSYNSLLHLKQPVITSVEDTIAVLHHIGEEIAVRSRILETSGTGDIREYNRQSAVKHKLPYLMVVIYELSDLMYGFPAETETALGKIAGAIPDTGIHLVMATQRPEPAVITDTLKSVFPSRLCFSVNKAADSVTILGAAGAEKLNEAGEMLYLVPSQDQPGFLRGFTISDEEIDRLVSSFTLHGNI
jgi:DNA segregation ATPase FtsK/SpoIIIE, S-DNA-T family